jgi:predicted Rdx family selenoprotein
VSLKHELELALGVSPTIRAGGPGQLDILVDGSLIFSKKSAGRSPAPGELTELIRHR